MGITSGDDSLSAFIVFSIGAVLFGFEEYGLVNYTMLCGPYRKVPGTPDYVLGYTECEGKSVLVQDLRVRFGLLPPGTRRLGEKKNIIIYQDNETGVSNGYVVDEMVGFSCCQTELSTPWGIEVLLESTPYQPFVSSRAQAKIDRSVVIDFWLLQRDKLHEACTATT